MTFKEIITGIVLAVLIISIIIGPWMSLYNLSDLSDLNGIRRELEQIRKVLEKKK